MNKQQERLNVILGRMISLNKECESFSERIESVLGKLLNDLHKDDFFGTEGQNDPRGDFRNAKWSMKRVEGVDK